MIRVSQIKIPIDINDASWYQDQEKIYGRLRKKVAKTLRIGEEQIESISISKHSIDARKKPELFDIYTVDAVIKAGSANGKGSGKNGLEESLVKKCRDKNVSVIKEKSYDFFEKVSARKESEAKDSSTVPDLALNKRICIIGAGPAGLFCGYELAMAGFKPIIFERGADVEKRCEIVDRFWTSGKLDVKTNVQFGEGGAGTFSDGKLNTMVKDKEGRGAEALDIFVKHGAPERIKYESKPHIGTDILKDVVKNIRQSIIDAGGEVYFENQVSELILDDTNALKGLKVSESIVECDAAVLAIGHSARDTFKMLYESKVEMQPKPFAVGFRVEHPQSLINKSQYGVADSKALPAAPYKLTTTTKEGRGVYSFCMCPGGYVVNASSEEGMLAVNGMSYSKRDGKNANSAIIITVDPKDFGSDHVLAGVEFQRKLEKKAFELAGGKIPVERYGDFRKAVNADNTAVREQGISGVDNDMNDSGISGVESFDSEFNDPQMKGSYEFAAVHEILPEELNTAFVEGMEKFGRIIKGYNDERALVSGVESRTSSPVRINRDENGESVNIKGLFPCGEGAGYAGGIMSAAMDGIRTAELVAKKLLD
ncbi:NAD(P)/FAD-dependent oxidoreductase [Butyrivibrio sp. AE2032]|uniref:NAD(P)/FAD-dependent oxidoreductase n=1 Tax=Butyrivibrio sp. AE2032 TaxID=1458463 RepID=UPI000550E49B|nr:NAD(P)-binding protein [Butyrivibrio sp. AE2032]